ncbi:hypothetical protein P0C27_08870 [Citrobacter freundii]|uniref:hypothetical protein n=1 Tax=Citrobacter freundii TaxID=546 RepID=UPI0023AF3E18|nr:hypothetical protein [Citrobacter freundii]MDE8794401.1 hypothetical protein [Citrobacter freundii]
MTKIAIGREMVDLAPIFQALPERNYLMNALDLFDGVGVQSPKVVVTQLLDDNYSLFNMPQSRYSSNHDTTARQNGKEYLIEIPWFAREDEFKPVDVQGRRVDPPRDKKAAIREINDPVRLFIYGKGITDYQS